MGASMKILFLCTANINRSRTAEDYFSKMVPGHEYRSAGLSEKYCTKHGTTLCSVKLLEWADLILVMESAHRERITEHTGRSFSDKIRVLDIPDLYQYMQPELITILTRKAFSYLNLYVNKSD